MFDLLVQFGHRAEERHAARGLEEMKGRRGEGGNGRKSAGRRAQGAGHRVQGVKCLASFKVKCLIIRDLQDLHDLSLPPEPCALLHLPSAAFPVPAGGLLHFFLEEFCKIILGTEAQPGGNLLDRKIGVG